MRIILLPFLLVFLGLSAQEYPQDYFRSPLGIELISSGTFGELRGNHFHSGIDLKTQGKEGFRVYAAADGYVSRIKVSPYGFGLALYLRHPNGYTTVYAHLREFNQEIEDYVVAQMKAGKKNEVDLFPPASKFPLKKGDVIALSGNSGGSGGPHLHYEIRDSRTEKIINPLLFGLEVKDGRFPELQDLQIYSFEDGVFMGQKEMRLIEVRDGEYALSGDGIVSSYDPVSFGIYAIDRQDRANNRNGVYSLKLYVGDYLHYHYEMETFAFSETRFINAHIDYALKNCCRKTLHRLFRAPGNQLSVYKNTLKSDHIAFEKDTLVDIRIEARDVAGNASILQFKLDYKHQPELKSRLDVNKVKSLNESLPTEWPKMQNVDWQKPLDLIDAKHRVSFPARSFYQDLILERTQAPACADCLAPMLNLGDESVPVHHYYDLALKVDEIPEGVETKHLFIASFKNGKYLDYEGGTFADGWLHTRTRQLGSFSVLYDNRPPTIKAINFKNGSTVKSGTKLSIRVRDNYSGIEEYNAWVDDQWVPVYYDAKTARLLIEVKHWPKSENPKQSLILKLEDDRGNQSTEKWTLIRA